MTIGSRFILSGLLLLNFRDARGASEAEVLSRARERYAQAKLRLKELEAQYRELESQVSASSRPAADIIPNLCQGRLTSSSTQTVNVTDTINVRRLYFSPHQGNQIALYYSDKWKLYQFAQLTIDLNASTATANKVHDVFVYRNDTASLQIEVGTPWTNDSTRAAALAMVDGIPVLSSDYRRRYIGSFRTNATTGNERTDDNARYRYVYSYCNRVARPLRMADTSNTWTYNGVAWRIAGADATNSLSVLHGVLREPVVATVKGAVRSTDTTLRPASLGIGIDTTTVNSAFLLGGAAGTTNGTFSQLWARYLGYPGIGMHTINWLESCEGCSGATNALFVGDENTPTKTRSGTIAWSWQ